MVNDLHRLGAGSVGGGGKGEGAKRLKTRDEQEKNIGERSEPSGGMETPQIPVRSPRSSFMWGRDDAEQHFLCTNTPDPPRREHNFPLKPTPFPPPPPSLSTITQ